MTPQVHIITELETYILYLDDDDFENLANDVRKLKRSMSMKKVTFEEDDYQFEIDSSVISNNRNESCAQKSNDKTLPLEPNKGTRC